MTRNAHQLVPSQHLFGLPRTSAGPTCRRACCLPHARGVIPGCHTALTPPRRATPAAPSPTPSKVFDKSTTGQEDQFLGGAKVSLSGLPWERTTKGTVPLHTGGEICLEFQAMDFGVYRNSKVPPPLFSGLCGPLPTLALPL